MFKIPRVIFFGLCGIPGFLLAIVLNYTLVEIFGFSFYLSYGIVLFFLTFFNYFIVDTFVFPKPDSNKELKFYKRLYSFVTVTFISRGAEWCLYSLIVYISDLYYILVQVLISILFVFIKYYFMKKIFK